MSDDAQVQELAGRVTALLQSEHRAQVQALTDRITASQSQNAYMKCALFVLTQQIVKLQGDVERLETERQWWRRWHLKWSPLFREWRDA